MKNIVTYTLIMLLAALIFYGGAGVNYVSYCCDDCRSAGVEAVVSDKCCDIHEHHHDHDHVHAVNTAHDGCTDMAETDCCSMERIDFDWDQTTHPVFNFQPLAVELLSVAIPTASLLPDVAFAENLFIQREAPPLIVCPRAYLSLLTTLLI